MTVDDTVALPPETGNALVAELAQLVLERAAPEELVLFEETAQEYFDDPGAVLDPTRRDEPVGFGLNLALLTPYVLAVVTPAVRYLAATVADSLAEESRPLVAGMVRRLLRKPQPVPSGIQPPPPLNAEQARRVRELAYQRALALGLDDDHAVLLADSVVGGLVAP
jgi:hypothetical protein